MTPAPIEPGETAALTRTITAADCNALIDLAGAGAVSTAAEMIVLSMWSTLLGMTLPGPGTNYLKQNTRFLAPVPLNCVLTARVTVSRVRLDKGLIDLETICTSPDGAIIASGRALVQARDTGRIPVP